MDGSSSWTALANTAGDLDTVEANSPNTDRQIRWTFKPQVGADVDTLCVVRLIAVDAEGSEDTVLTDPFYLDTRLPTSLANFAVTDSGIASVNVAWTIAADNHFSHYEIWYGTNKSLVENRDVSANNWNPDLDAFLANVATDSTMVHLLEYLTKYYFRIFAFDSAGNVLASNTDSSTTLTSAYPLVTGWDPNPDAQAVQFSADSVYLGYEVWDTDDSVVTMYLEMKLKNAASWTPWTTMRSYVRGDTGQVLVDAIADRKILWDARSQLGVVDTTAFMRVYAVDSSGHSDTATTLEFAIDTKAPVFTATLSMVSVTSSSIEISWNSVATDGNFDHYEVWYGVNQSNVQNRSSAAEWDDSPDDPALGLASTQTTTITGLLASTTYYLKIWAVDAFGNETAVADINATTDATTTSQLVDIADNKIENQGNAALNYGGSSTQGGATAGSYRTGPTTYIQRSLVRINNVGDIPVGATILSATFNSFCATAGGTAATVSAYRVLRDWNEGTANGADQTNMSNWNEYANENNWATAGCDGTGTDREAAAIASQTVNGTGWFSWNIVSAFQNWYDSTWANNGMLFVSNQEGDRNSYKYFHSAEGANVPYCEVTYKMEPPSVTGRGDTTLISAVQYDPDTCRVFFEVEDPNDATVSVLLQYKPSGGAWANAATVSGDTGSSVDATSGITDRLIKWNVRTDLGDSVAATYYVRVIAKDAVLADTNTSAAIGIDTKAPLGLSGFHVSDTSSYWMEVAWTPVSTEGHFDHYEVWYGSNLTAVENRTAASAFEYDGTDNNGLYDVTTFKVRVYGLSSSTKYYFKIWAVDSMQNEATVSNVDSAITLEDPIPTVTGWNQAAFVDAEQINPDTVRVGYQVIDIDDDTANVSMQYLRVAGGGWASGTISGDTGLVAIGQSHLDTILWMASTDLVGTTDENYKVRVIAVDDTGFTDTTESAAFLVDFVAPVGLAALAVGTVTATSADLSWTAATTESAFLHYEIYFGPVQSDVINRTGTALAWGEANDTALATMSTTSTVIDALNPATTYYFKIFAIDAAGNAGTTGDVNALTVATNDPVVTGLDDYPFVYANQDSTSSVSIGYEVDDANNATVTVSAQYQVYNGSSWAALTNATGKIGSVAVSATTNDTIVWNASVQLGAVDSAYRVRVIADDGSAQDTTVSDTFTLDTKAPAGLASFVATDTLGVLIKFTWIAATDRNFSHYEIWYGTNSTDVSNRTGTAVEWDNTDDVALAGAQTVTTTITGLTVNTNYFEKIWAVDKVGNETTVAVINVATKPMVTPAWSRTGLGVVNGGSVGGGFYIGTGAATLKLYAITMATGANKWPAPFSTAAYGICRMPTYVYSGGKYEIIASTGNYVVGRQDDGASSSQIFAPQDLGATPGNPYASPDDSTFYVVYNGNVDKRKMSTGATIGGTWPVTLANASIAADPSVFNDEIYVATTTGIVQKFDSDGTPLASFNAGASVNLPLLVDGGTLYVTPASANLYAVNTSGMTAKWSSPVSLAASNTGASLTYSSAGVVYVACGSNVQKVSDGGGTGSVVWTSAVSGTVESGPIVSGSVVYFGTSNSRYYAVDDADGSVRTNWPYTNVSGNASAGPWVDETNGLVIFGSTGGNIDAFTLE